MVCARVVFRCGSCLLLPRSSLFNICCVESPCTFVVFAPRSLVGTAPYVDPLSYVRQASFRYSRLTTFSGDAHILTCTVRQKTETLFVRRPLCDVHHVTPMQLTSRLPQIRYGLITRTKFSGDVRRTRISSSDTVPHTHSRTGVAAMALES